MVKGILYFHQGFTDIFNCLGLIDYYMVRYDELIVLCAERAQDIIKFYIKDKVNVSIILVNYSIPQHNQNMVNYLKDNKNIQVGDYDLLFHGVHEIERVDKYKNGFSLAMQKNYFFVKSFYVGYDIDYITRIDCFNITRDFVLEDTIYNNFIDKYGENYILYHEIIETPRKPDIAYVNLACISTTFFDYIKVLENSIELHLKDSVWSILVYLLACKYNLFENKKITIYGKRGLNAYYNDPIKLNNWIIKS